MNSRIVGYDLARGLAVFGMVMVNFKIVMGAESSGPGWLNNLVGMIDGRAAATFVVLAGVGVSLLSRSGRTSGDDKRLRHDRNVMLKRAAFLFVVGSLYTPIWPADILHFYGVYLAAAALLLSVSPKRLGALAVSLVLTFGMMLLLLDYDRGWDWNTLAYDGLWTPAGMVRHIFFNGFHPVIPWLAFLLVGMILGRLDMNSQAVRRRVFTWGVGLAITAETVSWGLVSLLSAGATPADMEILIALFGTEPMPPMPLYMIAGAGTACAVIAASISICLRYGELLLIRALVRTGQLALTLYVAHVIVGMGTLDAIGRLENQTLPAAVFATALFCVAAVVFAYHWRKRFARGPLEAVMRRFT